MAEALAADVAVIGGGPAGLAAAVALRRQGVGNVTVLDREDAAGGVPRFCGHPPFGLREFGRVLAGPAYARRLVAQAVAAGVSIRTGHSVVALEVGPRLRLTTRNGAATMTARRAVLATGVRETPRAARLISGDRPQGVVTTGTLQAMVYGQGLLPFRRPVVIGTELVSLSALLTCRRAGIRPVALIEANARPTARRGLALFPRLLGIATHYGAELIEIRGQQRVEAVALRLADGRLVELACDGVLLTGCFVPEAALVRASHLALDSGSGGPAIDQFGRCSDPTYYAAGNLLRPVETAGWSYREGLRIGACVSDDLAGRLPSGDQAMPIVRGAEIKLVVPQRLCLPLGAGGLDQLQLRVARAVAGELVVTADGQPIWRRRWDALPERRLLVAFSALPIPKGMASLAIGFAPAGSG